MKKILLSLLLFLSSSFASGAAEKKNNSPSAGTTDIAEQTAFAKVSEHFFYCGKESYMRIRYMETVDGALQRLNLIQYADFSLSDILASSTRGLLAKVALCLLPPELIRRDPSNIENILNKTTLRQYISRLDTSWPDHSIPPHIETKDYLWEFIENRRKFPVGIKEQTANAKYPQSKSKFANAMYTDNKISIKLKDGTKDYFYGQVPKENDKWVNKEPYKYFIIEDP